MSDPIVESAPSAHMRERAGETLPDQPAENVSAPVPDPIATEPEEASAPEGEPEAEPGE